MFKHTYTNISPVVGCWIDSSQMELFNLSSNHNTDFNIPTNTTHIDKILILDPFFWLIYPCHWVLALKSAAFNLITPKSPLRWRQRLSVYVGCLPTPHTQHKSHTHPSHVCQKVNTWQHYHRWGNVFWQTSITKKSRASWSFCLLSFPQFISWNFLTLRNPTIWSKQRRNRDASYR